MQLRELLIATSVMGAMVVPSTTAFASYKPSLKVQTVYVKAGKVAGTSTKGATIKIKRGKKTLKTVKAPKGKFSTTVKGLKTGQKLAIVASYHRQNRTTTVTVKKSATPTLSLKKHQVSGSNLVLSGNHSAKTKLTVKNGSKTLLSKTVKTKAYSLKVPTKQLKSTHFSITAKNMTTAGSKTNKYTLNYKRPTFSGTANKTITKLNYKNGFKVTSGVKAQDSRKRNLKFSTKGSVDVTKNGKYTVTYTATDDSKFKTSVKRVITVKNTAPTLTGTAAVKVNKSAKTFDNLAGVTAKDSNGKTLTVTVSGKVDMTKAGNYTLTYAATDAAGTTVKTDRQVTVVNDVKPTISGVDATTVKKSAKTFDALAGVSAQDSDGQKVTPTVTGSVNMAKSGKYTLTYTAKDSTGNETKVTRDVTVANDIKPTITGEMPTIVVPLNAATVAEDIFKQAIFDNVTATDSDGQALASDTDAFSVTKDYDDTKAGTYTVTYTAKDSAGNTATATRKVEVKAFKANSLTINGADKLQPTQTSQFTATMLPAGSQGDITWTSSDDQVAKVDANGQVTGVGNGKATITATVTGEDDKTITATHDVTVDDTILGTLSSYSQFTIGNISRQVAITFNSQDSRALTVTDVTVSNDSGVLADYDATRLANSDITTTVNPNAEFSLAASSYSGWSMSGLKVSVTVKTAAGVSRTFTSSVN